MVKALLSSGWGHLPVVKALLSSMQSMAGPELWKHVDLNDFDKVRALLMLGTNPDQPGGHVGGRRSTPLQNAVSRTDRRMVRLLLDFGADISQTIGEGNSLLHLVVRAWMGDLRPSSLHHVNYQNNKMVDLLIRKGCDVEKKNTRGWTALHTAAYNGNVEIVVELLQHAQDGKCGVDVLDETNHGETAEQLAQLNVHHRAKHTRPHNQIVAVLKVASRKPLLKRALCVAFAMGVHDRLAVVSSVKVLKPELLRLVLERVLDRV